MTNEPTAEQTKGNTEDHKVRDEKAAKRNSSSKSSDPHRIMLVPYPKFIFMYPTLIVSVLAAIVLTIGGYSIADPEQTLPVVMTALFLVFFILNTFIIVFDFPRATSLTLVFIATTSTLGGWLLVIAKPDTLPFVQNWLSVVRPTANASFFVCISIAMAVMYLAIFIKVRFNYWELRNNELLHHHGFLSDLKRYPAPNLRVDKEINDVFEFMLLGAGRLILHPTTEKRAIVLDNILFVSGKEKELTRVLGSIKVQLGNDPNL
ncbi:MAG: hypothetical protein P8L85_20730 [Rubripirellula sp.]|nr:hypothetical protein [Rubripirellula sp.]